tara:strand:+ start:949 stop:1077 length:129 start_codon:yes stop_codon:yes gene_type:complete
MRKKLHQRELEELLLYMRKTAQRACSVRGLVLIGAFTLRATK